MSDATVATTDSLASSVEGSSATRSDVQDDGKGSAGIFVERSGTRKIPLSGARYVFPKLTAFFTSRRPLEAQGDDAILMRNGRDQPVDFMDALACFQTNENPSQPQNLLAMQEQEKEVMVSCSKCGSYNMRSEENDAVHQPYYCETCQMQMSRKMLGAPRGSLETLEERTERDENSHLGVEDLVAMERELEEIAKISGEAYASDGVPQSVSLTARSRSRSPPDMIDKEESKDVPPVPPSPIRRFISRLSNLRSPQSTNSDSEEATTASSIEPLPLQSSDE